MCATLCGLSENGVNEAVRFSKSNNGEEEQIKEQKGHLGENQDWLSKLANLEVLPPPVQALGRMEKMRTSVVIDEDDYCDKTNKETGRALKHPSPYFTGITHLN